MYNMQDYLAISSLGNFKHIKYEFQQSFNISVFILIISCVCMNF